MVKSGSEQNYYDILGIPEYAGIDDVKKAYKRMVLKYHPDVGGSGAYLEKYKCIVKAYTILKDSGLKDQYDAQLKKNGRINIPKFKFEFLNYNFLFNPEDVMSKIRIFFKNISGKPGRNGLNGGKTGFDRALNENFSITDEILKMPLEDLEQRLIYSDNKFVKLNAATAIGFKKEIKSYPALEKMLVVQDAELKKRIIWAIGNLNMKKSINMLKLMYNNTVDPEIKIEILKAVFKITEGKGAVIYGMIISGINSGNEDLQIKALELLALTNKKINYNEFKNIFNNSSKRISGIIDALIAEKRVINLHREDV